MMATPNHPIFQPPIYATKRGRDEPRSTHYASASPRSSSSSRDSSSDAEFVFSPLPSPGDMASGTTKQQPSEEEDKLTRVKNSILTPESPVSHPRTQPIAIEQPQRRRSGGDEIAHVEIPLSGRGDRSGGYFPLHEDPSKRVKRSHPFHADVELARRESISRARKACDIITATPKVDTESEPSANTPVLYSPLGSSSAMPPKSPTRSKPPTISSMPINAPDTVLPMGKYYPTNYEARQKQGKDQHKSQHSHLSPSQATSLNSRLQNRPLHNRSASEARRRLQQYQRDMVAQASLRATQLLGKTAGTDRDVSAMAARVPPSMLGTVPLAVMQNSRSGPDYAGDLSPPRLQPLGSPGGGEAMTPMELGSLSLNSLAGSPLGSPDMERESDEIARALQAEAERQKREGGLSPGIEA